MKMRETIVITAAAFILVSIAFMMPAQAADDNTTISVYVATNGNVNASFNATADGDVTYWIDGIEVKGEFENIWDAIDYYDKELSSTRSTANYAFLIADSNSYKIQQDEKEMERQNQTLMIHYNAINNTVTNLLVLRDEVVGFEGAYFSYVNETNSTLSTYGEDIGTHGEEIVALKNRVAELTAVITFIAAVLIGFAFLIAILYFINRRYPLKQLTANGNNLFRSGYKQHKLVDFIQKTEATGKSSSKAAVLRHKIQHISRIRIRRNPEKSPLKNLFSFLLLIKGGKKQ